MSGEVVKLHQSLPMHHVQLQAMATDREALHQCKCEASAPNHNTKTDEHEAQPLDRCELAAQHHR